MVTYSVPCRDKSASDCLKTVEVEIGVPELSEAQLAEIFDGGVHGAGHPAPGIADVLDTRYFVPVSLDDMVCASCSRDRTSEIPDLE